MREYLRMIRFVRPYVRVLLVAVVFMILSSLLTNVASIGMIIPLVDRIIGGKTILVSSNMPSFLEGLVSKVNALPATELLNKMVFWIVSIFLAKGVFLFMQSYLMNDVGQRVIRDIRNLLYNKFLGLSLDFYSQNPTGQLVSRITYDSDIIQNSISEGLTDLIYQSLQVVILLCCIVIIKATFAIPWWLLFVSLGFLPTIIYPIMKIGRRLKRLSGQIQEKMGDINNTLYEALTGIRIVQAFSMEQYEKDKFGEANRQFYRTKMKSIKRMIAIGPMAEFVGVLCAALILWFGGKEVVTGTLSSGAFIAFLAALLSLIKPFNRLSKLHSTNQLALAAAGRIYDILGTEPTVKEKEGAKVLAPIKQELQFDNISFRYHEEDVLRNINLKVQKGEIIAFVGSSGAGKTTLVNLIPRFYDPAKGALKIDGQDIKDATLKSLREGIGIVTQETILFNDTVRANIAYGKIDTKEKDVINAAKIANAHDFIMEMPEQYNTVIGEKGFRLSGGERQRLALARAVLKNPPILILDEATSQLDTESEMLVQEAIDRLMKGRTVFVIAHRLSTVRSAARIVVLDKCEITQVGDHHTLMQQGGLYKRLYEIQFRENA